MIGFSSQKGQSLTIFIRIRILLTIGLVFWFFKKVTKGINVDTELIIQRHTSKSWVVFMGTLIKQLLTIAYQSP